MVVFPNCKINLGLNVLQKREDGYHNIETVFYPVRVYDVLEIITSADHQNSLTTSGIPIAHDEENLCLKAYYLLKKDFPQLPAIKMHLHKTIPVGAGLGGGSSDAAFALSLLNKKYNLGIPEQQLFVYALQLGSDCPYFLLNKPALAAGRGEVLNEITLSLSKYKMLLINPGIHINTKEIFKEIKAAIPAKNIQEIIQQPVSTWKNELTNDFEKIVFFKHEEIKKIKESMYQHRAMYAAMTGTGSTVFGIFDVADEVNFIIEKKYFHKWILL
jgi:4-diphosphocytidyl-2-C-methyl-D-erythritol kinase